MRIACWIIAIQLCSTPSLASVTVFYNHQDHFAARNAWMVAADQFTSIDFTGYPSNTLVTTQYAGQGVTFTDGTDLILSNLTSFPNDGSGLYGAIDEIHLSFSQAMTAIACDFPGSLQIRLYDKGSLIYTSPDFLLGSVGSFAGLISDQPFDAAIILDPTGNVNIDDLYFGPPIPAPGALGALAFAGAMFLCRRRRCRAEQPTTDVRE